MNNIRNKIIIAIRRLITSSNLPIIIAIDGCSGAGKSTIAEQIKFEFNAVVIPLDDFFSASIPDAKWKEYTIEEKLHNVFNWNILREDVLKPLKARRDAKWFSFNFNSRRADGTYDMETEPKITKPADIIILEGTYSSTPLLEDLIEMTILIDLPIKECRARLVTREEEIILRNWHKIWDEVEEYYFSRVRPSNSFTLVVNN
jgi:para-aminobenzoate synthetase